MTKVNWRGVMLLAFMIETTQTYILYSQTKTKKPCDLTGLPFYTH